MKIFKARVAFLLIALGVICGVNGGLTDMASGGGGAAGGGAAGGGLGGKEEGGSTVNVISQNAVEANQNATEVFLERLERKNTLNHIQQSIDLLKDKLKDITTNVENRLVKINAQGNPLGFHILIFI